MMVSSDGRAKGLSVLRTVAELFKMMLEEGGNMLSKPSCLKCGSLCEVKKCMCMEPPVPKVSAAEQHSLAAADIEEDEAPRKPHRIQRRISFCWTCGGGNRIVIHGILVKNIGVQQ